MMGRWQNSATNAAFPTQHADQILLPLIVSPCWKEDEIFEGIALQVTADTPSL